MKRLLFTAGVIVLAGCADTEENNTVPEENNTEATETEDTPGNAENNAPENEEQESEAENSAGENENNEENNQPEENEMSAEEATPIGNYAGNIAQGGHMAVLDDTLYTIDFFENEYGIFEMPLDGEEEPEKLLEVFASHIHAVEDGLFYIDHAEMFEPTGLHFYDFGTGDVEEIVDGPVRNPQMTEEGLWFLTVIDEEEGSPMAIHRYDLDSGEVENMEVHEVNFAVNNQYEIHQYEIYLHEANGGGFDEEDAITDEATAPVFLDGHDLYFNGFEGMMRYNMQEEEMTQLSEEPIAYFNARDDHIFYSPFPEEEGEELQMYYMSAEGDDEPVELDGYDSIYMFDGYGIARRGTLDELTYDRFDYETGEWSTLYYTEVEEGVDSIEDEFGENVEEEEIEE
ncbi:DUF5050 domain-containing protein [Alkalicoccus daliensis]|uniref:Prolow-density lipoprotein receptor-related protein 1-like beta-propeller domain-containing protein n=1 Tax=Alkalicoccus daliensis TaxID=745820 RepID=A0A1H0IYH0_9BACI|nr:DUF5050 domain-containing protein [Alkalicoccus daliensis]SDO36538.1 protein of unknown function [Alkalicoccus daliensis]